MPHRTRWRSWLLVAALTVVGFATRARAANPQSLDIHVSINTSKSLTANTTTYDFGALGVNVSSVSSPIIITNNSGALIETYRIQGANALSDAGGQSWTLASSTGTDQYALAAQFSSAQPTNADGTWSTDDLTTSAQTCTSTVFGNGTAAESGESVSATASNARNLWFRMRTPDVVTDPSQHTVTLTLSVL